MKKKRKKSQIKVCIFSERYLEMGSDLFIGAQYSCMSDQLPAGV